MKNKDNLKKQNKNMVSKIISSRLSAGKLLSYLFLLTILLPAFSKSLAQAPHGFNYQAVLRDSNGEVKQNENVNIAVELIQNTIDGPVVFNEIHTTQTNAFGLVNLHVGSENGEDFENVDWSAGPYYVRISVNGIAVGTSPLLSVPYALHAETADKVNDGRIDPVFVYSGDTQNFADGEFGIKTLAEITMMIPEDGFVLLTLSGNSIFFRQGRVVNTGIGTNTSTILHGVTSGYLDGSSSDRFRIPFSITSILPVTAGEHTFYALVESSSVFSNGFVNIIPISFTGVFFPNAH